MTSKTKNKRAHTAPTQYGTGDYYGTAIRNPRARKREDVKTKTDSNKKTQVV